MTKPSDEDVSLATLVRAFCDAADLPFDRIADVRLNHPEHPTKVTVLFAPELNLEEAVIEITYPKQG